MARTDRLTQDTTLTGFGNEHGVLAPFMGEAQFLSFILIICLLSFVWYISRLRLSCSILMVPVFNILILFYDLQSVNCYDGLEYLELI